MVCLLNHKLLTDCLQSMSDWSTLRIKLYMSASSSQLLESFAPTLQLIITVKSPFALQNVELYKPLLIKPLFVNEFFCRVLAICFPMRFQITGRRARLIILLIWILALTTTLPWPMYFQLVSGFPSAPDIQLCVEQWPPGQQYQQTVYFIVANVIFCYLFPLVLICLCYVMIWVKVWSRSIPTENKDAHHDRIQQRSKVNWETKSEMKKKLRVSRLNNWFAYTAQTVSFNQRICWWRQCERTNFAMERLGFY